MKESVSINRLRHPIIILSRMQLFLRHRRCVTIFTSIYYVVLVLLPPLSKCRGDTQFNSLTNLSDSARADITPEALHGEFQPRGTPDTST
jgi:hypothetical protein